MSSESKIPTNKIIVDPKQTSIRPFLDDNFKEVLEEGLNKVAKETPSNPIKFLGNFLLERAEKGKKK